VLLLVFQAFGSDPSPGWADHPALRCFDLAGAELPDRIFLVRTRGTLPTVRGVTVLGSREGLYAVSGEESAVIELLELGCGVFPLEKPDSPFDPSCSGTPRVWTHVAVPDPGIVSMVSQVNWEGISSNIQWLVDFGTRYSLAGNHFIVAGALADRFVGYGLAPVLYSYQYNGTTLWNVEATQTGTVHPDSFIVVCGHFDSVSGSPYSLAPGADDNGTGTATVLTAAEILSQHQFEYSILYICFSGEEQGLRGSKAYAAWAAENGLGIVGVLNFDMLGYWEPGVEQDLEIETNEDSQWFAQAILNAADLYTETPYELHVYDGAWWGDHASFWAEGFAAVNHEEAWDWGDADFNPYYHSTEDLLQYIGEDFMVENVQICVAALATLAVPDYGSSGTDPDGRTLLQPVCLSAQPNPFRDQIEFSVSGLAGQETVRIIIYDPAGRRIDTLEAPLTSGAGSVFWTAGYDMLPEMGTALYFVRIEGSAETSALRVLHLE